MNLDPGNPHLLGGMFYEQFLRVAQQIGEAPGTQLSQLQVHDK